MHGERIDFLEAQLTLLRFSLLLLFLLHRHEEWCRRLRLDVADLQHVNRGGPDGWWQLRWDWVHPLDDDIALDGWLVLGDGW